MPITKSLTRPPTHRLTRAINDAGAGGGPQLVAVPAGFGWTPPVNVYKSGSTYSTDYDPTPFLVEGDPGVTTYYVDSATGSEANPGTAALPKASLRTISNVRTNKLLIKARGTFYKEITGSVFVSHDNLCVEAWGGAECVITTETNASFPLVWTDEGGGVWSAPAPHTGLNGIAVYSGTDVESLTYYPQAASLAACQSTPGSIFRATGPIKHYVHTLDGTSPASGHTIYGTNGAAEYISLASFAYDQRIAFHGVSFRGGNAACQILGDSAYSKRVDFVGCSFKRADSFAAFHASGGAAVITLYQCTAGPSRFDGFSATTATGSAGGTVPSVVEIECIGRDNGYVSAANQGSTTHFGGKYVRVGCQYYNNSNDQAADVGAGTRSWNLGVAVGPKGVGSDFSGFQCGNDGTDPTMWLDGCTFTGLDNDVCAQNATATIYYRNMGAPDVKAASNGTVTTY